MPKEKTLKRNEAWRGKEAIFRFCPSHQNLNALAPFSGSGAFVRSERTFYKFPTFMDIASSKLNFAALRRVPFVENKLYLNTRGYRITDFFSVAQMLEAGQLRLTCMNDYSDSNKGIDRLVQQFVLSVHGRGPGPFGVHDALSAAKQIESPRISRRLKSLRGLSHEEVKQVPPRSPGARSTYGAGAPRQVPIAVGSH